MTQMVVFVVVCWFTQISRAQSNAELEFFETTIRPLLATHCFECHGSDKQFNGLRLDSADAIAKGGDTGPAIKSGHPEKSLLYEAVTRIGELKMPPESKLTPQQTASIRHWIEIGAPWPKSLSNSETRAEAWQKHWAFQPIVHPTTPVVSNPMWCSNPIDCFVMSELDARSLSTSGQADRRTLIRRVTLDVTGLLPNIDEIEQFENDANPNAYENLVDQLLASPTYGQQFARQWLDVARYSDTKGYVYAREERFFVNASAYRNWVIQSFNEDLPYNRFLQLQIAADQETVNNPESLIAMGFLTLGRRFLGVTHDIIDDRIDVVTRGTMGLTAACARCHDHKYDPIPTADYYSLYGVFQNSAERQVEIEHQSSHDDSQMAFQKELQTRKEKLTEKIQASRMEASKRVRERIADYLYAQSELHRFPEEGFDQVLATTDLIPSSVRRWESYLARLHRTDDPIFGPWFRYASIPKEQFEEHSHRVHSAIITSSQFHPSIKGALLTPVASLREVADRYGALFKVVDSDENSELKDLQQVLYGVNSPCEVPDEEVVSTETFFDSATCTELWRLQGEVDRWRLKQNLPTGVAVALFDRNQIVEPRIFKRGNPASKGEQVSRHFLSRFASLSSESFSRGSGRLELADAIIHPHNPLTARVWVNRIWQHHFGEGLVRTPSDFGLRAEPPSHPMLLDWLARQLMEQGWSTKDIHRLILTSATYRQSSLGPSVPSVLSRAIQIDPENRGLWRMSPRRLRFEEIRDSLLEVSGDLDLRPVTKPADMFGPMDDNHRRTIFGLVDRQFLAGTLRIFDFANPDLHIAKRSETSVPQQALFFMNHPFVAYRARSLISHLASSNDRPVPNRQVSQLYTSLLQRNPTPTEMEQAIQFLREPEIQEASRPSRESLAWKYGYGEVDETLGKLKGLTELPHFTGNAWQGGANYPDKSLGWVQLTAAGGHPGNDHKHACVRRWVAPNRMTVNIRSTAKHEPEVGDGVRFRILSSRDGPLKSLQLKASQGELDVDNVQVEAGDTLDFVVDIFEGLNSDQHLWSPEIRSTDLDWNASRDFSGPVVIKLSVEEQLAQILMLTNEFIFVD